MVAFSHVVREPRSSSFQLPLVLLALIAIAALWWSECSLDPRVAYLDRQASVDWIEYPLPSIPIARAGNLPLRVEFEKSFELEAVPPRALLRIRALRDFELWVNGVRVAELAPPENWKRSVELDIARRLHPGANELRVSVSNLRGPTALWMLVEGEGLRVASDPSWSASALGSLPQRARVVGTRGASRATEHALAGMRAPPRGTLRLDLAERLRQPHPWPSLRARALPLAGLALLGAALGWWLSRPPGPQLGSPAGQRRDRWSRSHPAALAVFGLLWGLLWFHNRELLPATQGFDALEHVDYVAFIQAGRGLPVFSDGGQMFQPPVFYGFAAACLSFVGLDARTPGGIVALRSLTLLAGLAQVGAIFASLRLLLVGQGRAQFFGLVVAACLPVHLYVFQYVTNEGLAATLMTVCIALALRLLGREDDTPRAYACLGLCLGLAILTKVTAVLVAAAIVAVIAVSLLERRAAWRAWLTKGGTLLACAAIGCGWYFAWLWWRTGRVVLGGWDPGAAHGAWWQDPGLRSAGWYLRFGESLVLPRWSGFESLADGMYSTLWGDGLMGGAARALARPPWNDEALASGYLLALIPTAAIVGGAVLALGHWWRGRSLAWLLMFAVFGAFFVGIVQVSLMVPVLGATKAFYALGGMVSLCAFAALGFDALARHGRLASCVAVAVLCVWAGNAYRSYWIDPELGSSLHPPQAGAHFAQQALRRLAARVEAHPDDAAARHRLGAAHAQLGNSEAALAEFAAAAQRDPANVEARLDRSLQLRKLGRRAEALEALESLVADGTIEDAAALIQLGRLRGHFGRRAEALEALRLAVGARPLSYAAQLALAKAWAASGDRARAREHARHAHALAPERREAADLVRELELEPGLERETK